MRIKCKPILTISKFNESSGVVNVFDCIEANGTAYIIMEYIEGQTLKEYISVREHDGEVAKNSETVSTRKLSMEESLQIVQALLHTLKPVSYTHLYIGWDSVLEQVVAIKEYLPSEFATRVPGEETITIYSGEKENQFAIGKDKFADEAKRLAQFNAVEGVVEIKDTFLDLSLIHIWYTYSTPKGIHNCSAWGNQVPFKIAIGK